MLNISQILAQELSLKPFQVENALQLFSEGATIPFVARYRKEITGSLDEIQLRDLRTLYLFNGIGRPEKKYFRSDRIPRKTYR